MTSYYNAFVSYGRADSKAFALRLNQRLAAAGLRIWVDLNDIPLGVDFQQEIDQGIQASDNFIFIIAPHAANSSYCRSEIERALQYNKRIIPLLHVETIDRDTWQQRFPQGGDRDWQDFQDRGLHTSFIHLHSAIRRINWINFREGIDDFEVAVQGLLELCQREQDYVHHHTVLLTQALAWQPQQPPHLLLVGEERQRAEAWLKQRFQSGQPPCLPTDLHYEFITESIKNANNLMTQVFLAYAEVDGAIAAAIRRALMRQGITVWTSQQDIATGTDFQQAIDQGIEGADNLLYLLSPASLQSSYCQHELDYALALHKRIIPMQVTAVAPDQVPTALAALQYIDLAGLSADPAQQQAQIQVKIGDLLRILQQDETYYNQHKVLLVKALKWERQHRNPTMLLRGSSLHQAESWLQLARPRSQHQPTPLQTDFITESLRLPPASFLDVFVSYSRTDSAFARRLNEALQVQGKTTWFDQESIPPGADFQQEIWRGIEQSNYFLFVLSPSAVESSYCATEVEHAQQLNKRVVTVLHRPVDPATLHPILAAVQWIDFSQGPRNFSSRFEQLIRTLDTDEDHLRAHTRLLVRAIEWQTRQRRDSLLLRRGDDLEAAEDWLTQGLEKQPRPTPLQVEYLKASRVADEAHQKAVIATLTEAQHKANRRLRLGAAGMVALLLLGALLGLVAQQAVSQVSRYRTEAQEAKRAAQTASDEKATVQEQLSTTRRRAVTQMQRVNQELAVAKTEAETAQGQLAEAITRLNQLEGNQVSPVNSLPPESSRPGLLARLPRQPTPRPGPEQPDYRAPGSNTGPTGPGEVPPPVTPTAPAGRRGSYLYDLSGQLVAALTESSPRFSPDGKYIVTTTPTNDSGRSILYTATGEEVTQLMGQSPRFSPDGKYIATTTGDTSTLYSLPTLTTVALQGRYPVFSPGGDRLATYSADGFSYLYDMTGDLAGSSPVRFPGQYPKFSADGQWLLTSQGDRSYLYAIAAEKMVELAGHSPSFSPNRQQVVATAPDNHSSYLYDLTGRQWGSLQGGYPSFSAQGSYIITHQSTPEGKTVSYLHNQSGDLLASFPGTFRALSPDHRFLLVTEGQRSVLYTLAGDKLRDYEGDRGIFSPDGLLVMTIAAGDRSNLYTLSGDKIAQLDGQNPTFSPGGQYIVTFSKAGQSYLYDRSGQPIRQFAGQFPRFSPSGTQLTTDGPQ